MFTAPEGFTVARKTDVILLVSPAGSIAVDEHLDYTGAEPTLVGGERVVTCEGERAVVTATEALVLLDDTYIRIEGRPADAAGASVIAKAVRDIATSTRACLGESRRRRFWYEAPREFDLGTDHGVDTWLAPTYPAERSAVTVPRAMPIAAREHVSMVKTLLDTSEDVPPSTAISPRRGLRGQLWQRSLTAPDGVQVTIAVVALTDGRYDYFVRAIGPDPMRVLAPLIASIEPLPRRPAFASSSAMAHWAA